MKAQEQSQRQESFGDSDKPGYNRNHAAREPGIQLAGVGHEMRHVSQGHVHRARESPEAEPVSNRGQERCSQCYAEVQTCVATDYQTEASQVNVHHGSVPSAACVLRSQSSPARSPNIHNSAIIESSNLKQRRSQPLNKFPRRLITSKRRHVTPRETHLGKSLVSICEAGKNSAVIIGKSRANTANVILECFPAAHFVPE